MTTSELTPQATPMPSRAYRAPGSSLVIPIDQWISAGGSPDESIELMGLILTLT